jgi:hypothetical protein
MKRKNLIALIGVCTCAIRLMLIATNGEENAIFAYWHCHILAWKRRRTLPEGAALHS